MRLDNDCQDHKAAQSVRDDLNTFHVPLSKANVELFCQRWEHSAAMAVSLFVMGVYREGNFFIGPHTVHDTSPPSHAKAQTKPSGETPWVFKLVAKALF